MTQLSKLDQIKALAAQAAETGPDMTEVQKGGGGYLFPAGYAFARLVGYTEYGMQPQEFGGKAKDPADTFRLTFAVWGEGYANDDGTPRLARTFSIATSRFEKARAFKLFKSLNWKSTATHFAELLGEAFLLKFVHVEHEKTKKISARIDLDGFLPPLDPVTKAPYGIPAARDEDLFIFLWDYPTKDAWDALFVEGKNDEGKSKNWEQETILGALNFVGSPLETLLGGSSALALPDLAVPDTAGLPALPSSPAMPSTPSVPVTPAMPSLPTLP